SSSDGRVYMLGNGANRAGYVVYAANRSSFTLAGLTGGPYEARLYDPTHGDDTLIGNVAGSMFSYQPSSNNFIGDTDWVIYLKPSSSVLGGSPGNGSFTGCHYDNIDFTNLKASRNGVARRGCSRVTQRGFSGRAPEAPTHKCL